MSKTSTLSRRCHLFITEDELMIKLQKLNVVNPTKQDYYIIKRFPISTLIKVRDWANENIQALRIKDTNNG